MELPSATPITDFSVMEYFLILFFQLLGIGFHVGQKVISIGDKFPNETPSSVIKTFWKEDWDTLAISGLVLLLDIGMHYTMWYIGIDPFAEGWWKAAPFGIALFLGYAGQRVVYKFFGTTEKMLDKQINNFEQKNA